MIFAETPLWCGAPFAEGSIFEKLPFESMHKYTESISSLSSASLQSASTAEIPEFSRAAKPKLAAKREEELALEAVYAAEAAAEAAAKEAAFGAYLRQAQRTATERADGGRQYVPVPVPMGAQAGKNGLYEDTSFA